MAAEYTTPNEVLECFASASADIATFAAFEQTMVLLLVAATDLARMLVARGQVPDWAKGCPCYQCRLVRVIDHLGLLTPAPAGSAS